ncbi:uncharacterized protein LOC141730895 [Zonotrichia albicollis]|uniref:uncharacterized protein LOC141730895 n=1 Tax=Zonotrichia albicollis TaxID=44394 RepID=UPI003D810F5F
MQQPMQTAHRRPSPRISSFLSQPEFVLFLLDLVNYLLLQPRDDGKAVALWKPRTSPQRSGRVTQVARRASELGAAPQRSPAALPRPGGCGHRSAGSPARQPPPLGARPAPGGAGPVLARLALGARAALPAAPRSPRCPGGGGGGGSGSALPRPPAPRSAAASRPSPRLTSAPGGGATPGTRIAGPRGVPPPGAALPAPLGESPESGGVAAPPPRRGAAPVPAGAPRPPLLPGGRLQTGAKRGEPALGLGTGPERGAALAARGGRAAQHRRCVPASLRRGGGAGGHASDRPSACPRLGERPCPRKSCRPRLRSPPSPSVRRCPLRPPPPQPGMAAEQPPAEPRSRCRAGTARRLRAGAAGGIERGAERSLPGGGAGCPGSGVLSARIRGCWVPGLGDVGCPDSGNAGCSGSGLLGARAQGCWVPGLRGVGCPSSGILSARIRGMLGARAQGCWVPRLGVGRASRTFPLRFRAGARGCGEHGRGGGVVPQPPAGRHRRGEQRWPRLAPGRLQCRSGRAVPAEPDPAPRRGSAGSGGPPGGDARGGAAGAGGWGPVQSGIRDR